MEFAPIEALLALTRILAVVFTAPVLGSRSVPFKFRVIIGCTLTLTALPLIGGSAVTALQPGEILSAILSEVVIGTLLGLGVMIMFAAAQTAGTIIGQMAGIQISGNLDPQSGQSSSPVGQVFAVLSLAAFALIGGPELVISAVLDTFVSLPLGSRLETSAIVDLLARLLQQSFILTLRGVAPAVAALMISTIVIGLVSRTYPQMNMFGIGLSSNLIVMMLAIFFTLGGCVWLFVDDLNAIVAMIANGMLDSQAEIEAVPYP
jgi:flagellar biosynthetic protein FliR